MISRTILFYWSKGADIRRKTLRFVDLCEKRKKPCFLISIAKHLGVTHPAIKKHLDLLVDEGYVKQINPHSKPVFIELTQKGKGVVKEILK